MSILTALSLMLAILFPAKGEIQVNVSGLKNTTGQLGILLFEQSEGWPSTHEKAMRRILLPISGSKMQYTFKDVPYGKYAVSVMHDENKNGKLDLNFFGIPKEGNGVSNNATNAMGPPRFSDAQFSLSQQTHSLSIKVNY